MTAADIRNELLRMFPLRWELRRGYRLPSRDSAQPYYISWHAGPRPRGEGWTEAPRDADGVLMTGNYYNPVRISQFALYSYARAVRGDARARAAFFAQANYLARAQDPDGGYRYPIANSDYGAPPGWLSAMAQGEASSVLVRAFAQTGDAKYLRAARAALRPLERDVSEGGASSIGDGIVFFEEVAAPQPCHILNGHLYAAFAVWEFVAFGYADEALRNLHERALETLVAWLPRYDAGGWSCYDLAADEIGRRHYAPLWYHHFHIAQLRVYGAMTGRNLFTRYADKWNDALSDNHVRFGVWRYNAQSLARAIMRRTRRSSRGRFVPILSG